jgi:perosamine synthetase
LKKEELNSYRKEDTRSMWKIPIACPDIGEEEARAVYEVVKSGWISEGKKVQEFEKRFADYIGVRHAVACFNGTAALHIILLAYGIGPGDEIIVPSMTFVSTATSVLNVGASPVFSDIDSRTFNIDPKHVEQIIESSCELKEGAQLRNRQAGKGRPYQYKNA